MPRTVAETPEYIVLDKPAGLIVHSDGRTVEPSVAEWLAAQYPDTCAVGEPWVSPQGEVVRVCGLVHRLDRTTSGVLVAARTAALYTHLKHEFKARRVEKVYRAIVHGHVQDETGRIVAEIARSSAAPKRWYAKPCDESYVRAAITEWRVLVRGESREGEPYSYLELVPKTGRTHQIRVHLSSIGHPIVGDHLYAPERAPILGFTRSALHAFSVAFVLPSGERVLYEAPLPTDFHDATLRSPA
ncbi:MAG: ribosomal large subunit pseudouridine synthase rRNA synthase [Candidatus Parcubacteria bacterium]|jgi:23S rRNA pseudouridine1911/1915/1917 synthase